LGEKKHKEHKKTVWQILDPSLTETQKNVRSKKKKTKQDKVNKPLGVSGVMESTPHRGGNFEGTVWLDKNEKTEKKTGHKMETAPTKKKKILQKRKKHMMKGSEKKGSPHPHGLG